MTILIISKTALTDYGNLFVVVVAAVEIEKTENLFGLSFVYFELKPAKKLYSLGRTVF